MSTSDPSFSSAMEVIKHELEKFQNIKTAEIENAVRERDALKKEVEELRSKKIKSDKIARFYKTRVLELEHNVLTAQAALSSNKRTGKRKGVVEYSGTEEEEDATGHNYKSGVIIKSEDFDNYYYNLAKPQYIRGSTYLIPQIINNIKNHLKKGNSEKFQRSCFGQLLTIDELKFQGQLLLQFLLHMDMAASNKECLVFNINNSRLEFRAREFCLITGLRLGTMEEAAITTSSSSVLEKVFGGKPLICLKDFEDRFLSVSSVCKGGDEMPVKLALLYFLYGIVLAGNNSKQVDQQYLHLIEDLEEFNAFPWGRLAYETLASSMLLARRRIDDSEVAHAKPSVKPSVNVYGFCIALQVWAYEVMPSLGEYCAVRANNAEDHRVPRILCWSTLKKKKVCFKDLEKFFRPGDEPHLVLEGIRATPWELEVLTTGSIPPRPKKEKLLTQTHANHVVQAETQTQTQPHVERRLLSTAGDVMIINDSDDDEAASNSSQSQDSDDDLSDGYMNKLVVGLTRKMS